MDRLTNADGGRAAVGETFLIVAAVVVSSLVFVYFVGLQGAQANREIVVRLDTMTHLNAILSAAKDAETGQRGYLLTHDPRYLEPYRRALKDIAREKNALRRLAADGQVPSARIGALDGLIEMKLAEMNRTITVSRTRGVGAAVMIVLAGTGRATMDDLRALAGDLLRDQEAALGRSIATADRATGRRSASIAFVALLNLALLAWTYRRASREIRERQRAVEERIQERETLRTTLASIGDGVIATDAGGRVRFMNPEAESLTGWTQADALGHPLVEIFHVVNEDTRRPTDDPVGKVIREGRVVGLANHTVLVRKDGGETPIDDSAAPVRFADGRLDGVVLVFRDVTERRRAEDVRARLAVILDSSADAIVSKDLDGLVRTWNKGAERIFGWRAEEIVGRPMNLIIPPERAPEEAEILDRLRSGRSYESLDTIRKTKDGRLLNVSVSMWPIRDDEGRVTLAASTVRDISDRKQMEADLRSTLESLAAQRRLYHTILSSTPDLVYVFGLDHRFAYANDALLQMWGKTKEEAIGRNCLELGYPKWHAERHDREIERVKATKTSVRGEVPFTGTLGRRIYDYIFVPVLDADGRVEAIAGTTRDVTELRQHAAELEQTVAARTGELKGTIEELERFTYTVAHDLRAPLRAVHRFSELVMSRHGELSAETVQGYLRNVTEGVSRMDRLIADLLAYSKVSRAEIDPRPVDVDNVIKELLAGFASEIEERRATVQRLPDGHPRAVGDAFLLSQVLANLLSNALKFVPPGRKPEIEIGSETKDGKARLWVRDNGIGIDARFRDKVFKLFERLHGRDAYPGTGIGLAIASKAVEKMGGVIGFDSEPGKGSRFWVEFPEARS